MTQRLQIRETLPLPLDVAFSRLADHQRLGAALGVPVRRTRDGEGDVNGLGSVRTLGLRPLEVDETITRFDPPTRIDYRITRGSPLRDHRASVIFSANGSATEVTWNIEFDIKPRLLGPVLKRALGLGIRHALRKIGRAH